MTNTVWKAKTFLEYAERLADPEVAGISDAIIQFVLSGKDGGILYYRIGPGGVKAYQGYHENPDVTITTSLDIWVQMVLGKIRPIKTYLSGKVEVKGDIVLAQRALKLFRKVCAREKELLQERPGDALYLLNTDTFHREPLQFEIPSRSEE